MKKFYLILLMMAVTLSASALSKSKSRRYSLYLSDKMAYELDLTDEQFEAVYQINYDYFRSIYSQIDIDMYWPERDENMYYVLDEYQYEVYTCIDYFYDPITLVGSSWSLPVYTYYIDTSLYYRPRPAIYRTYRGGYISNPSYYRTRVYALPTHHDNMRPSSRPVPGQPNVRVGRHGNTPTPSRQGMNRGAQPNPNNHGNVGRPDVNHPNNNGRPDVNRPNNNGRPDPNVTRPNSQGRPVNPNNNNVTRPDNRDRTVGRPDINNRPDVNRPNNNNNNRPDNNVSRPNNNNNNRPDNNVSRPSSNNNDNNRVSRPDRSTRVSRPTSNDNNSRVSRPTSSSSSTPSRSTVSRPTSSSSSSSSRPTFSRPTSSSSSSSGSTPTAGRRGGRR